MGTHSNRKPTPGLVIAWTGTVILCTFGLMFAVAVGTQIFYITVNVVSNPEACFTKTVVVEGTPVDEDRPGGKVKGEDNGN